MKRFAMVGVVFAFAGCASSSGVIPTGQDTYMVARKGASFSTSGLARADAMQEASEFCAKAGKQMRVIKESEAKATFGNPAQAQVDFSCAGAL